MTADTCRVDKVVNTKLVFYLGVNCITGSTCNAGNDNSLLTAHTVDNGGLTRIRLSDYRNVNNVLVILIFVVKAALLDNCVKQVARACAV